jgi:mono/diheme cytochrome c family protein
MAAFCLGSFLLALTARAETASSRPKAVSNPLVWDSTSKRLKMDGMGKLAEFTFWVTNTAPTDASILRTETSCDCTVADLPSQPWVLRPGESGSFKARLNITGKFGLVTNEIGLVTTHGPQVLTVVAEIPLTPAPFNIPVRERDRMVAQRDRQAVFSNTSCAVCHAVPAAGKTGAALFAAACGICHDSGRRAEVVPDLTALNKATDADYWRTWITEGKDGTLMPAFARSSGGILDTNQIETLVDYLSTDARFKK